MNADDLRWPAPGGSGQLSDEILAYLRQHPEAQDTVEGIAEWWLLERRVAYAVADVRAALAGLVQQKFLVAERRSDGRTCYHLNPERDREIASHLRIRQEHCVNS